MAELKDCAFCDGNGRVIKNGFILRTVGMLEEADIQE